MSSWSKNTRSTTLTSTEISLRTSIYTVRRTSTESIASRLTPTSSISISIPDDYSTSIPCLLACSPLRSTRIYTGGTVEIGAPMISTSLTIKRSGIIELTR